MLPAAGLSGNINEKILPRNNEKKMHIGFLRVPKTGSSTLFCIFVRFGIKNNLKMYIPKSHGYVSPKTQRRLLRKGNVYDIFTIHTHYNSRFFKQIVPKDSVIIGSVREPFQRIISDAFFSRSERKPAMRKMMNLSDEKFIHTVLRNTMKYGIGHIMATYFGMELTKTDNVYIHQYLENLNPTFHLVVVLEKFNESLVLLKRMLNWSFADILYDAKNVNTYGQIHLSEKEKQNLYSTNMLDFEVYSYFKRELEKKIDQQGNDFKAEVLHFENILPKVKAFCGNNPGNGSKIEFPSSKWDNSFFILASECELIFKLNETIIKKQYWNMS